MCIRVLGNNRKYAGVGDIIIGVVKDALQYGSEKIKYCSCSNCENKKQSKDLMEWQFVLMIMLLLLSTPKIIHVEHVYLVLLPEKCDKRFTKIISLANEVV
jgi:large subunit ribosomal protein L14